MLIGYTRVSTQEQNLDMQISALKNAGCEKIYEDKMSGKTSNRPGLQQTLEILRKDDVLVVYKLDRLGRSVKGLIELVNDLHIKNVSFKSITDSIDTTTPAGRFFFHILASLAEMERELIVERTRAGLIAAKNRGQVLGRKRKLTIKKVESAKQLLLSGLLAKDVASTLGVSVATLYRRIPGANNLSQLSISTSNN